MHPWTPRFKITLRALLAVMVICAAVVAYKANSVRATRSAVNSVKQLNGNVEYRHEYPPEGDQAASPPGPKTMRSVVGDDFFVEPYHVDFTGSDIDDEDLKVLQQFNNVELLTLAYTNISDIGLKTVASMSKLKSLGLDGTHITDNGLHFLKACRRLKELTLSNTQITDESVNTLCTMKNLKYLDVSNTRISANGRATLSRELKGCEIAGL
jgi:Leucine-rich repeat (LRR) protein